MLYFFTTGISFVLPLRLKSVDRASRPVPFPFCCCCVPVSTMKRIDTSDKIFVHILNGLQSLLRKIRVTGMLLAGDVV